MIGGSVAAIMGALQSAGIDPAEFAKMGVSIEELAEKGVRIETMQPSSPRLVPRIRQGVSKFRPQLARLPHQGEAEKARRRRQMERAARKQEVKS